MHAWNSADFLTGCGSIRMVLTRFWAGWPSSCSSLLRPRFRFWGSGEASLSWAAALLGCGSFVTATCSQGSPSGGGQREMWRMTTWPPAPLHVVQQQPVGP
nr:uncharacterized protein LOC113815476 [Penaeus vannamei]